MMRVFAGALLVLACAGCSPDVVEADANEAVDEATAVEAPKPAPSPSPTPSPLPTPDNVTTEAAAGANGLPADVQRFVERREGCEHWAGEPDYDAARRKQIEDAVKALCPGIDTQLAALRKTYAGDPRVMAALADFEPLGMDD